MKGENAIKNLRKGNNSNTNKNNQIDITPNKNWKDSNFDNLTQDDNEKNQGKPQTPQIQQIMQLQQQQSNPVSLLSFGGAKSNFVVGFSCQNNKLSSQAALMPIENSNPITSNPNPNPNADNQKQDQKNKPLLYQKRTVQKPIINKPLSNLFKIENEDDFSTFKDNSNSNINKGKKGSIQQEPELLYDYNQNLKSKEQFEDISNLIIEPKNEAQAYNSDIQELNAEISKMKSENTRVSQLREEYEKLNQKLQKDYKEFNIKKEQDYNAFEAFKNEETKILAKERKQLTQDQKAFNDIKVKMQTSSTTTSKKDKDQIEALKAQLTKAQEDFKLKDNTNKLLIDRLKKQLDEANSKINELTIQNNNKLKQPLQQQHQNQQRYSNTQYQNKEVNSNPPLSSASRISKSKSKPALESNLLNLPDQEFKQSQLNQPNTNQKTTSNQISQVQKESSFASHFKKDNTISNTDNNNHQFEEEDSNYDMVFPDKYHNTEYTLLKQDTASDGKVIRFYDKDKKEILFPSGVRKEIFNDGYQIVYFNNGDIKQIYPNGKTIYYFSEVKTIQTTFGDKQVYKFENGQIEQHYKDGTKRIAFPDGSLRYVLPDGSEETYYLDGKIQKKDVNGVITIEHEDGSNEVQSPE